MKECDYVRIVKSGVTGTIVYSGQRDGRNAFIVEPTGWNGETELPSYYEDELELIESV